MISAPDVLSIVPPVIVKVPATVPRALALLMFNVPAVRVVPPVNVFAPESVQVPASTFVSAPLVVPRILTSVPPAAPPSVRPRVAPVIVPALLMLIIPVSPTMLLVLPRVINPAKVAPVAELFITAPPPEIPVPFIVSGSALL